jgi:hypothetical protein
MSITQQVHLRIVVFDALAMTIDLKVLGQMQVFVIISSKVSFI